jgi:hypothetical protein
VPPEDPNHMKWEEWKPIFMFKGYSASNMGRIRNDKTERILELNQNQQGVLFVGLVRAGYQYHRGVAKLVANAFIPRTYPAFDTPINLNGDRTDCRVENLVWRPRWFAVKYNQQFLTRYDYGFPNRVQNTKTGEVFENSWECAIRNGLLERDLVMSIFNRTYVWPLYVEFKALPEE